MSNSRWAECSLSEACTLITDGTHHSPPNGPEGEFKYVTAKNIRPWGLDLSDISFVTPQIHAEIYARCPAQFEDVLYIKDGVTTGLAAVNPLREPFSMLSSVALLRTRRELLDPYFLCHWLNSPSTFRTMTGEMTGTAIRRLVLERIRSARIRLPPVAEQRRIVAKLDALFARNRAAKTTLERVPALLERLRQAILAAAFRGELQRTRKGDTANSGSEWLPPGWRWASLGELAPDSFYGPRFGAQDYVSNGIPTIRTTDIDPNGNIVFRDPPRVALDASGLAKLGLRDGDLLITRTGSIGRCALYTASVGPALPSAYLIRFRPDTSLVIPKFLLQFLLAPSAQRHMGAGTTATTQPNINAKTLAALRVPLPPLQEQREIVEALDHALAAVGKLEASARTLTHKCSEQERVLLSAAFRGELVPQDPGDEPASALLERIRAERELSQPVKRKRGNSTSTPARARPSKEVP